MHYQRLATAIIIAACLGTSACQKAADSEGGSASSQASPKTIKAFQDHVAKFSMTLFRAEADGVFNGKTGLTDLQPLVDGVYFRETLIKATLPGFFVREAATPKFASS